MKKKPKTKQNKIEKKCRLETRRTGAKKKKRKENSEALSQVKPQYLVINRRVDYSPQRPVILKNRSKDAERYQKMDRKILKDIRRWIERY